MPIIIKRKDPCGSVPHTFESIAASRLSPICISSSAQQLSHFAITINVLAIIGYMIMIGYRDDRFGVGFLAATLFT